MWHPGAQWGRPPSPADCNFHSRWFQNAFHELSETPFLLNALPNLRGFRGTLCSQQPDFCPVSNWMLKPLVVGVFELAIFYCWFSVSHEKVAFVWWPWSQSSWNHSENTSADLRYRALDSGKTCELVLEHLHQLPVGSPGQFLNSGSLSEEGEKKGLRGDLDIYVKFHVWKNCPQLLFLVMRSHWKRSAWKMFWKTCAYKCVIWKTEPLEGRKKKKIPFFFTKKIPKYLPLG